MHARLLAIGLADDQRSTRSEPILQGGPGSAATLDAPPDSGYWSRPREQFTPRTHLDPDDRWHCCELWQRSLSNKWNAREFARKHGCEVPALYWYGRRLAHLGLEKLPNNYVIKPAIGQACRRVYVMCGDIDLMRHTRFTTPSSVDT